MSSIMPAIVRRKDTGEQVEAVDLAEPNLVFVVPVKTSPFGGYLIEADELEPNPYRLLALGKMVPVWVPRIKRREA